MGAAFSFIIFPICQTEVAYGRQNEAHSAAFDRFGSAGNRAPRRAGQMRRHSYPIGNRD